MKLDSNQVVHMEIWKDVPGLNGVRASSEGRVWLPASEAMMPSGKIRSYKTAPRFGTIARPKRGECFFRYVINIKRKTYYVHQLVCWAFHGVAPFSGAFVLHIDENGLNNRANNLKWGTQKENLNMPKIKAFHRSRTGDRHPFKIAALKREISAKARLL